MAFVEMSARGKPSVSEQCTKNRGGHVSGEKISYPKQANSDNTVISGPGALLITSGLLLASGSLLIEMLELPITSVFAFSGLVFAALGGGYSISERRNQTVQQGRGSSTSEKIDQLSMRLDEGIESLRDVQWEMRDSEMRYRDLLDNQLELILRRDRSGRISFVNDAFCQTFSTNQNATIGALFEPQYVGDCTPVSFEEFGDKDRYQYELQLVTSRGPRWFSFEDAAIRDEQGELREVHSIGRDITDEKKTAENLQEAHDLAEQANHAKTRFLATMSHEIRTPMNGIMGMNDLLSESTLSPEQRTYCQAINKSATTLLSLIDEILDFSKIEAGKFEMVQQPYNISEFAQGVVELMAPRAFEKGLSLGCFVSPDLSETLIGDEMRMRQILLNLIGNAIKFTEYGGITLEVGSAGEQGELLRFTVYDTGIGLSESDMERIFVEFEQIDSSNSRRNGGTGLGLAITRRLVEKMGGEISVASVLRKGSVFTVDMALKNAPNAIPLREKLKAPAHVKRVLIACDHELDGDLVGKMLKTLGIEVVVLDRRMAFEILEDKLVKAFDVVITDAVEAPRFAQNLARLAEQHAGRPVKGLMLIEATNRQDYVALREKGYDSYVTRPIRHISLIRQLENLRSHSIVPRPESDQGDFDPKMIDPSRVTALLPDDQQASKSECHEKVEHIQAEGAIAAKGNEPEQLSGKHKARILLAEDNEINALLGCRLLEHMGYHVTHVTDGQRALAAVKESVSKEPFDVVLMDIHMPHMDGIRATKEIRAFEEHSGFSRDPLSIVALTANAFDEVKSECYSAGMNAYLAKPFAREELRKIIEHCLTFRAEQALQA